MIELRKLKMITEFNYEIEIGVFCTYFSTFLTIDPKGGINTEDWLRNFLFMQHQMGKFTTDLTRIKSGETLAFPRYYGPVDDARAEGMLIDLKAGMDTISVAKKYP